MGATNVRLASEVKAIEFLEPKSGRIPKNYQVEIYLTHFSHIQPNELQGLVEVQHFHPPLRYPFAQALI